MAPAVGFEPTTNRLTADRSTTELRWIAGVEITGGYVCAAVLSKQPQSVNPDCVGTLPLSYAGSFLCDAENTLASPLVTGKLWYKRKAARAAFLQK